MSAASEQKSAPRVKFGVATTIEEKEELITRNLEELMGAEKAREKLRSILQERDLKVYWGTATTGQPHIAYFVPMSKIADFLRAGCEVTILFADLHAFLDNMKSSWELLKYRTEFYEVIIKSMLESIGVPLEKLRFIRGTEYQLSKEYTLDVYKLSSLCTDKRAIKAGAEVVKQSDNALLSGLLYPLLQALDEEYLKVDAQFGGTDQRKIFTLCEEFLPKIGYTKRLHLMNPMVAGLQGAKMSSSEKSSKIGLLDPPATLQKKIRDAFCEEGNIEQNGVLSFVKMVLLPLSQDGTFTIERPARYGGNVIFSSFTELERSFAAKEIFPLDLKNAVTKSIDILLVPIRKKFQDDPKLVELLYNAYPEERAAAEEEKKAAAPAPAAAASKKKGGAKDEVDITKLDIRVGRITKVGKHESADTLYVEEIDVGEAAPRQVVSGLANYYTLEQMQDRLVVVLCNMKPSKLRGVESKAMVLAAASEDGKTVELLEPPSGAKAGERLRFEGYTIPHDLKVEIPRANEKVLATVTGQFRTNSNRVATWNNIPFTTSAGPVTVASLIDRPIK